MILIDAVHIHNAGGKKILDLILERLNEPIYLDKIFLLLDNRYKTEKAYGFNKTMVCRGERDRFFFYLQNTKSFSCIFCLNNLPPPILIFKNVYIYFHNILFLENKNYNLSLLGIIQLKLKYFYIKLNNKSSYKWMVQTERVKKVLNKKLNIKNETSIIPIYENVKFDSKLKIKNSFLCVTSSDEHKNLNILFKAFILAAEKINEQIQLKITVSSNEFLSRKSRSYIPKNLKIDFLGTILSEDLHKIYSESEFLIFPSLNESFGLPLIEAINFDCQVLASDLEYVHSIVRPSYVFNPLNEIEISEKILFACKSINNKKSFIKVENKLENFVEIINQYV